MPMGLDLLRGVQRPAARRRAEIEHAHPGAKEAGAPIDLLELEDAPGRESPPFGRSCEAIGLGVGILARGHAGAFGVYPTHALVPTASFRGPHHRYSPEGGRGRARPGGPCHPRYGVVDLGVVDGLEPRRPLGCWRMISTRRLSARPSEVALSASGFASPIPTASIRSLETPCDARNDLTASARSCDSRSFMA